MRDVPRRLAVLFLLATTGILVCIGAVLGRLGGPVAVAVYTVLVLAGVLAASQLAKRQKRIADLRRGRTCTCCTGTIHDPVKVI